jgi:hypothetical protein
LLVIVVGPLPYNSENEHCRMALTYGC